MGLLDNFFGRTFDFNRDGKTTWNEKWLAYKIYEEIIEKPNKDLNSSLLDDDSGLSTESQNPPTWRDFCEDGSEFDVAPQDYETEYEYEDALEEAKYAWRENCMDGNAVGIYPEDYDTEEEYNVALIQAAFNVTGSSTLSIPVTATLSVESPTLDKLNAIKKTDYPNERQYEAAYTLANEFIIYSDKETEQEIKAACHFILEQSSTVIAANYLTVNSGFLFAQAVKDHFTLPVEFPDEDAERNTYFSDMIMRIAQKDIGLSLRIWEWCVEQFMPYAGFDSWADKTLTCAEIDNLYEFPEKFKSEFVRYIGEHPAFCHALFRDAPELSSDTPEIIYFALQSGSADISKLIFEDSLINAEKNTDTLIRLVGSVIFLCNNCDELESMELFQLDVFPLVLKYASDELEEEIGAWKKEMAEYIRETERDNKKYAFSRCNSWRKTVPNGKKYGLDVCEYDTQQEYLDRLNEEKYGWRSYYGKEECLGLNPSDYETQREFDAALQKRSDEAKKEYFEQRHKEQVEKNKTRSETPLIQNDTSILDDKNTYNYCGVVFHHSNLVYHYRTDDSTIKIGDSVIVPVGNALNETEATIVSVGQYTRLTVPFPVEKTRFIIKKVEK